MNKLRGMENVGQCRRRSSPQFGFHLESWSRTNATTARGTTTSSPGPESQSVDEGDQQHSTWSPQETGLVEPQQTVNVVPLLRIPVSRRVRSPEWPLASLSSRSSRAETGSLSPLPADSDRKRNDDDSSSEPGSALHASTLCPTFGCALTEQDSYADIIVTNTSPESTLEDFVNHSDVYKNRGRANKETDVPVTASLQQLRITQKDYNEATQDLGAAGGSESPCAGISSTRTCQESPMVLSAGNKKTSGHPASLRAIEMLRTGTRLTLAGSGWSEVSEASVSEPGSTPSQAPLDGPADCLALQGTTFRESRLLECVAQDDKYSHFSGAVGLHPCRGRSRMCVGQDVELEEGEVLWGETAGKECSAEMPPDREAPHTVSQEVQTSVSSRCVAVQNHVVHVEEKTQTRRISRCHRGVSCDLTRKIASLTEEAMKAQNAELTRQLDYHVATGATLTHDLQRERQVSQERLEAAEKGYLFSEELRSFLGSSNCALAEAKAAFENQKAVSESLKAELNTVRHAGQQDKDTLQQNHHLLIAAMQRQLKIAKEELSQLEEQKEMEVCRHRREAETAKQRAQGLEEHYTSQISHMQKSHQQTEEALTQAREEILKLRGESREKDVAYSRKLHETEAQSTAEQIQREATERAYQLSLEKDLLSCRLEIDRLRIRLDHSAEKLAATTQAHVAQLRALEESKTAQIRQKVAEHDAALSASRRREREMQELVDLQIEDVKCRTQLQQQAWEEERITSNLALTAVRRQCSDAVARVEELEALPAKYEESIRTLRKQVDDLSVARQQSEAEVASLLNERRDLLEALQSLAAEQRVFREEAERMKDRLLRAVADRDEALRRAEAFAVDQITTVRVPGKKTVETSPPGGGRENCQLIKGEDYPVKTRCDSSSETNGTNHKQLLESPDGVVLGSTQGLGGHKEHAALTHRPVSSNLDHLSTGARRTVGSLLSPLSCVHSVEQRPDPFGGIGYIDTGQFFEGLPTSA
ncbi:hypothetical protein CSUI_003695 [Cystoisospora suis]|uniref:Uncharacterized protein n=1 Tax=Cystoisospora suis TaxID=483139 RepID=A0A2C6KPN9_9APIC|nr:hypothetical protein CSUI_003695 [Cystoisospora suis]